MKRIALLLALAALLALVLLPGLHSHGDAGRACVACVHEVSSAAVLPAPVAPAHPVAAEVSFERPAPRASALVRRATIDRPRSHSPPASLES